MTPNLGTLLLQAREAHREASAALNQIHRNEYIRYSLATGACTIAPSDEVRREVDRLQSIVRAYGEGLRILGMSGWAVSEAEDHFKRAVAIAAGRE